MFKDFVTKSEAHFNLKINLYCDNGEYLFNEIRIFFVWRKVLLETPQLNECPSVMSQLSLTKPVQYQT